MKFIVTLLIFSLSVTEIFGLNCFSCEDENGKPNLSCTQNSQMVVTECSTEEPVCGMYYYKDLNGSTLETGCVTLNFCAYKAPLSANYEEYSCRTCYGVDLCNSRFLKPQGLELSSSQLTTPSDSTTSRTSTVGVSKIPSPTENIKPSASIIPATVTDRPVTPVGTMPNKLSTIPVTTGSEATNNPIAATTENLAQENPTTKKPSNSSSVQIFTTTLLLFTVAILLRKN